MPRGQSATEYLLLIGWLVFMVIVALSLIRFPLFGAGANQLTSGSSTLFTILENFGSQRGCALVASPSVENPEGGNSTITIAYQKLTPTDENVTVNCGTGNYTTATGCVDAANGTASCSVNCTYPSNAGVGTVTYSVGASVGGSTCSGTQVIVTTSTAPFDECHLTSSSGSFLLCGPAFSGLDARASNAEYTLDMAFVPLQPSGVTNNTAYKLYAGPVYAR